MKNYINKQNFLGLLLVIGSIATNNTNNASQTPTNIEKEFDKLIDCALYNPDGRSYRKGGRECGKYFLPVSNDKANLKTIIEATDFSEEGQRVANEFVEKFDCWGRFTIYAYIQRKYHPNYTFGEGVDSAKEESPNKERFELAEALQDQMPISDTPYYRNLFLQYAGQKEFTLDNLFDGAHLTIKFPDGRIRHFHKQLPIVTDEQDQKNIIETIARRKRQTQS